MKTASAKSKGRLLQQRFRDEILKSFPYLGAGDVRSCPMGSQGEDIQLSPLAREIIPFDIEAKARAAISVYKWLEQRKKGKYPPLVYARMDRKNPICILYAADLLELLERASHEGTAPANMR